MLHKKPSKLDRACVIPIGGGVGAVCSQNSLAKSMISDYCGTIEAPFGKRRDHYERRSNPIPPGLKPGCVQVVRDRNSTLRIRGASLGTRPSALTGPSRSQHDFSCYVLMIGRTIQCMVYTV
jgi:hypothetical protein